MSTILKKKKKWIFHWCCKWQFEYVLFFFLLSVQPIPNQYHHRSLPIPWKIISANIPNFSILIFNKMSIQIRSNNGFPNDRKHQRKFNHREELQQAFILFFHLLCQHLHHVQHHHHHQRRHRRKTIFQHQRPPKLHYQQRRVGKFIIISWSYLIISSNVYLWFMIIFVRSAVKKNLPLFF